MRGVNTKKGELNVYYLFLATCDDASFAFSLICLPPAFLLSFSCTFPLSSLPLHIPSLPPYSVIIARA